MLFSERDMAALRLLCWCQYVRPEELGCLATETEVKNLMCLGLVKRHRSSGAYALTIQGRSFMAELFPGGIPDLAETYHKDAIQRRLRVARLALTAYLAGAHVFTTSIEELSVSPALFLSAITRSRGSNPWGSTRIAALARLGDLVCGVHYVCPGIGKVALTDELTAFTNQAASLHPLRRGMIFAGGSYAEVLAELEEPSPAKDTKLIPYGEAYRCLGLPVYLLSCDRTGALQLRLMAQPDYRRRLTKAALKAQYHPPPEADAPALDAVFCGMPFVMAVDMDLRRIEASLNIARGRGCPQIAMAALEGQAEAVLFSRYRAPGLARVFVLTEAALAEVLGGPPTLFVPTRTQYQTARGDVVDAPPIQADRKAGGPH